MMFKNLNLKPEKINLQFSIKRKWMTITLNANKAYISKKLSHIQLKGKTIMLERFL